MHDIRWFHRSLIIDDKYQGYYIQIPPHSPSVWGYLWNNEKGYHEFTAWRVLKEELQEALIKEALKRIEGGESHRPL